VRKVWIAADFRGKRPKSTEANCKAAQQRSTVRRYRIERPVSIARSCKTALAASIVRRCRIGMPALRRSTATTRCAAPAMPHKRVSRSIAARRAERQCNNEDRVQPAPQRRGGDRHGLHYATRFDARQVAAAGSGAFGRCGAGRRDTIVRAKDLSHAGGCGGCARRRTCAPR